MGDRCSVTIAVGHTDRDAIKHAFGSYGETEDEYPDAIESYFSEVNGVSDELGELQEAGVPFYGYHTAGYEYPAMAFAFDGEEYAECESTGDGMPIARIQENGEPELRSLADAQNQWAVYHRAKAAVARRVSEAA